MPWRWSGRLAVDGRRDRQPDGEDRLAWLRGGGDRPMMLVRNDTPGGVESQSCALFLRFRSAARLDNPWQDGLRGAAATVVDFQNSAAIVVEGPDRDSGCAIHGGDSVVYDDGPGLVEVILVQPYGGDRT